MRDTPNEQVEQLENRLKFLKSIVDEMSANPKTVVTGVKKFEEAFVAWGMSDLSHDEVMLVFKNLYTFMVRSSDNEVFVKHARVFIYVEEQQGLQFYSQYTPNDDPPDAFYDLQTREFKFSKLTWRKIKNCALAAKYYMAREENSFEPNEVSKEEC